uniref:Plastocyanin-like domain-containing protein n=1 Tax=Hyaloperonospora arabidopsidis (strain Emoy2) TaxID=559515 RepID=M4BM52_HYAAE
METSLPQLVGRREVDRRHHGITELRERICELSWNTNRDSCFVHHREGCRRCKSNQVAEPDHTEWSDLLARYPLTDEERPWIGSYEPALSQMQAKLPSVRARLTTRDLGRSSHQTRPRSASPLASRTVQRPQSRSPRPHRPSLYLERLRVASCVAPTNHSQRGSLSSEGEWRDTLPLFRGKVWIRFTPRDYMLGNILAHCHMASHGDAGMSQLVNVHAGPDKDEEGDEEVTSSTSNSVMKEDDDEDEEVTEGGSGQGDGKAGAEVGSGAGESDGEGEADSESDAAADDGSEGEEESTSDAGDDRSKRESEEDE